MLNSNLYDKTNNHVYIFLVFVFWIWICDSAAHYCHFWLFGISLNCWMMEYPGKLHRQKQAASFFEMNPKKRIKFVAALKNFICWYVFVSRTRPALWAASCLSWWAVELSLPWFKEPTSPQQPSATSPSLQTPGYQCVLSFALNPQNVIPSLLLKHAVDLELHFSISYQRCWEMILNATDDFTDMMNVNRV